VLIANSCGALAVIVYTMIMTYAVLKLVSLFTPIRVSEEEEMYGLDETQHGERVFNYGNFSGFPAE
jgi:Amt family ammonium transporter